MKYLSIILLILFCGCKEKKTYVSDWTPNMFDKPTPKNPNDNAASYAEDSVRKTPLFKMGYLSTKEYDVPKHKAVKHTWRYIGDTSAGDPVVNNFYPVERCYDSSLSVSWDCLNGSYFIIRNNGQIYYWGDKKYDTSRRTVFGSDHITDSFNIDSIHKK